MKMTERANSDPYTRSSVLNKVMAASYASEEL